MTSFFSCVSPHQQWSKKPVLTDYLSPRETGQIPSERLSAKVQSSCWCQCSKAASQQLQLHHMKHHPNPPVPVRTKPSTAEDSLWVTSCASWQYRPGRPVTEHGLCSYGPGSFISQLLLFQLLFLNPFHNINCHQSQIWVIMLCTPSYLLVTARREEN